MNKIRAIILFLVGLLLSQCGVMKETFKPATTDLVGKEGLMQKCLGADSINSLLITKVEAILTFDKERYEVNITVYWEKDSIIYLSAVNSGFEILRASVKHDSIRVINRRDKIVYRAPLQRKFGYQYPVNFDDLQNLICSYNLCKNIDLARDDQINSVVFEFDEKQIKKRIALNRIGLDLRIFEFYHRKTHKYLMGEKKEDSFKIYSNFMIAEFEITTTGGNRAVNRDVNIKMEVNPRKYTFTELR